MPHFLATKIYTDFPLYEGEYKFCYQIPSLKSSNISLICVHHKQRYFFLQAIQRENDILCKGLGITRLTPVGILKKALWILAQKSHLLSHNLQNTTLRQEIISPFLLSWKEVLELLGGSLTPLNDRYLAHSTHKDGVVLEIGFGSGRHLLDMAQKYPQKMFIGLEIHTPSLEQVLRQIELLGLENLYVLCFDVRLLMEVLPSNSIDCIYLHFPVPWNKAKHRRVMGQRFLAQALRVLKKEGFFELRSDDYEYFIDTFHLALASNKTQLGVCKNIKQDIVSKYEARWARQSKDIFDLRIWNLENSADIAYDFDVTFPRNLLKSLLAKTIDEEKLHFLTNKQVFQEGFLHIGDIYQERARIVFVVSLGDFLFPLNRIFILEQEEIKCLPTPLIPSKAVKIAYKKFIELLENV